MGTNENIEPAAGKADVMGSEYRNLFAILEKEHDEVSMLLEQVRNSDSPESVRELFIRLRRELLSHLDAEEEVFYARLERIDSARSEVREGLQEHEQLEWLLEQLDGVSLGGDDWESILEDLKDSFDMHVEEEEDEIFPMAQKLIDEEEAQELGQRYQNEKNKVLGRLSGPSPWA